MKLIIRLSSVTYAVKAKEILSSSGVKSAYFKNPKPKRGEGCGYILVVEHASNDILDRLSLRGIDVSKAEWEK